MDPSPQLLVDELHRQEAQIREGGGHQAIERQHGKNRLTARERIAKLIDSAGANRTNGANEAHGISCEFFELGLWAAWNMYGDWGGAPSAGVVTGIGIVE